MKEVKVQVFGEKDPANHEPYKLLKEIIEKWHTHLANAKIALAWNQAWKADVDGILHLGHAKKATDLDYALHGRDFILQLNRDVWESVGWTEKQARALLDHLLCHCDVRRDSDGAPMEDEHKRTIWRVRKHDVEEFKEVLAHHGTWIGSIADCVRAAVRADKQPLLKEGA